MGTELESHLHSAPPVFLTSLFLKAELDKNGCAVQALLFVFLKVEIT